MLVHGRWCSPGAQASSTTKTGHHDIAEKLLKVALNTINQSKSIICYPLKRFIIVTKYVWFMVFNATFNNISVISWVSVTLVEDTAVLRENHWLVTSHWQTLSHNVVWVHLSWAGLELTTLVVIGIDCIGCHKSNYHTIMTTMVPCNQIWMTLSKVFDICNISLDGSHVMWLVRVILILIHVQYISWL